jgi:hypothetical protein
MTSTGSRRPPAHPAPRLGQRHSPRPVPRLKAPWLLGFPSFPDTCLTIWPGPVASRAPGLPQRHRPAADSSHPGSAPPPHRLHRQSGTRSLHGTPRARKAPTRVGSRHPAFRCRFSQSPAPPLSKADPRRLDSPFTITSARDTTLVDELRKDERGPQHRRDRHDHHLRKQETA